MKEFICQIDTETKTVAVNGYNTTLINGKVYSENNKAISLYPHLFNEIKIIDIPDTHLSDQQVEIKEEINMLPKANDEKTAELLEIPKKHKNFSWPRFSLLVSAVLLIGFISGYLRVHGISIIFHIDIVLSTVLVLGFIISELAISSLLLREIKSKMHHLANFAVLGIIQLLLIGLSFVFEFSTMSNWVLTQKNEATIVTTKENIHYEKIVDIERQIKAIEEQIKITPEDYMSKRSRLTVQLNKLINKKNEERSKIEEMLVNEEVLDKKINKSGFEVTSTIMGTDEYGLTKGTLIVIAGILNILYVFFMYGFISEWKRRD